MPELSEKKKLKEFINENGFFLHATVEELDTEAFKSDFEAEFKKATAGYDKVIKMNTKVPDRDGIVIEKGLVSQRFGKGEKNRNGYRCSRKEWSPRITKRTPKFFCNTTTTSR